MDILIIFALFIVISALITFVFKKKTKFDTYYLITMIKTRKPIPILKAIGQKTSLFEFLAELSIIFGFGAIAADFLYGRKQSLPRRIITFITSFAIMAAFFIVLDLAIGNIFSNGPLTKDVFLIIVFVFGVSGFAGFTLFSLVLQAFDIILKLSIGKTACPGVAPLIPGVKVPNVPIVIPLHAWLSLFIILIIHEGMHGIIALRHKLKLKSTGIVLLGFLPIAAFVEPKEDDLEKLEEKDPKNALKFLAAGAGGNLLAIPAVFIIILVLSFAVSALFVPWQNEIVSNSIDGVYVAQVDQNMNFCGDFYESPSYGVIDVNSTILRVNDVNINNSLDLQRTLLLNRYKESHFVLQDTNGTIYEANLKPNDLGSLGFAVSNNYNDYPIPEDYRLVSYLIALIFDFLTWLLLLNFLVALVNFLPMSPFDGGKMGKIIFSAYFPFGKNLKEKKKKVGRLLFAVIIAIILLNMLPLFL